MDNSAAELNALARRCRELARRTDDKETCASLHGLATYYDAEALAAEPKTDPKPPISDVPIQR
jgi:hypothetical protein